MGFVELTNKYLVFIFMPINIILFVILLLKNFSFLYWQVLYSILKIYSAFD